MEILVAILVIALIAAIAFAVMQRRPGAGRQRTAPIARRKRRVPPNDPMAAAVEEQIQAMDPQDVVASEQRLQAEARRKAAPMVAEAERVEHQRAADQVARGGAYAADPRMDGAQAGDRAYAATPPPTYGNVDPAASPAAHGDGYPAAPPPANGQVYAPSPAAYGDPPSDDTIDPATGARRDAYRDPDADPRYNDPNYDGPPDRDHDPRYDEHRR